MLWRRGEIIGKGGYGEVFVVHTDDPQLRTMAVKSAPAEKAESLIDEHRFLADFVNFPGIVQTFGASCGRDSPDGAKTYNLFMEYAPGGSLAGLIAAGGGAGIPESQVRVYTRKILRALSAVHSRGIVHCDIKPDNILVFPAAGNRGAGNRVAGNRVGGGNQICYELKIADFGLAMETSSLVPGTEYYRGTTRYMSPEVLVYGKITPAADIWALGCTVLEMLTGQGPWSGLDKEELKKKISEGAEPPFPDWLSEEAKSFLMWCFDSFSPSADWLLSTQPFVAAERYDGGGDIGAAVVEGGRVSTKRAACSEIDSLVQLLEQEEEADYNNGGCSGSGESSWLKLRLGIGRPLKKQRIQRNHPAAHDQRRSPATFMY